jgi:hypothetical protein
MILFPNEILYQHLYTSKRRGVNRYTANFGLPTEAFYHEIEVFKSTAEFACFFGRFSSAENLNIRYNLRDLDNLIQNRINAGKNLRD